MDVINHACLNLSEIMLTHLPLVPHVYVSELPVSIGSDNGLSPIRCQAIFWINAG